MAFFSSELLPDPESVIPTEFYDVRSETTPKAGWVPMYIFTVLIYIAALVAFVTLFQNEARKSTTETVILPYDNTGNDGYTCQMISRVTATYQIPATADPSLAYNLVNVMESKTKCETDLALASPCSSPMIYFPGTATQMWAPGILFSAAAMYDNRMAYVFDASQTDILAILGYSYATGEINGPYYGVMVTIATSLAVSRTGSPVYLMYQQNDTSVVYVRQSTPGDIALKSIDVTSISYVSILNDNLYNIYVINANEFVAVNIYVYPVVSTVLFTLPDGDNIEYAAVYHDGTSPTVYYYSTAGAGNYTYYQFKDGITTAYEGTVNPSYGVKGMVTDGSYVYFLLQSVQNLYLIERCVPGEMYFSNLLASKLHSAVVPPAFAISSSGDRIFTIMQDSSQVETWGMLYLSSGYYSDVEFVTSMTGFGAQYFTCNNQLLNETQYVPQFVAEYPQACESNGLAGRVLYSLGSYYLSDTDAQTFAVNKSAAHCPALATPICNTVAALPPYSCSRTLRQGFFACAATAVANAQFLVQVLVFLCAVLLPKLAKRFPAAVSSPPHTAHAGTAAASSNSSVLAAYGAGSSLSPADTLPVAASTASVTSGNTTADSYVEMAAMRHVVYDVENPLGSA